MKTLLLLLSINFFSNSTVAQSFKTYLFVGTFTDNKPDKGIYVYEFNDENGKLIERSNGDNLTNPSFLTISRNGKYLYACTDSKIPNSGNIAAFKFNCLKGSIGFLNKQPSGGENPVYVTTSKNDDFVISGNYTEGTAAVFRVNADGSLPSFSQHLIFKGAGINRRRQDKSHIHSTVFSPDFKYLYISDLGADKIHTFHFNNKRSKPLKAMEGLNVSTFPGSGPRHLTFHPNKKFAYSIEELSGKVSVYQYKGGELDSIQRVFAYSKRQEEYNSADIHISPDGLFLYASNRWENENTIAIFSVNQKDGRLILLQHQKTLGHNPRNFTIDPSGRFLLVANQSSNNIVVFRRNTKTGLLSVTEEEIKVPNPSCLKMRRYKIDRNINRQSE